MHLIIPFASTLDEAARHVLGELRLPQLAALLAMLAPAARDEADEHTLSTPHERALAHAWGWRGDDGALPFAARAAAADGIAVGTQAWGLLTPVHWSLGRDHVTLADPDALALDDTESRELLGAVRELFESEGFTLAWGAPLRWYAAHDGLDGWRCASLDRVIGRDVDPWLRGAGDGSADAVAMSRLLRRLQSEVQLLLYHHPVNEARESRGALTVNSFWLSGCGRRTDADDTAAQVDDSLRRAALTQDWVAWAQAWRTLDAGALAPLRARVASGATGSLTLCGERTAQRFDAMHGGWLDALRRRWHAPAPQAVLEGL